jgi:hypothetical protein
MAGGKVTLASLDQKLESFMEMVKQHIEDDREFQHSLTSSLDGNGKPGLKTRLELAELKISQQLGVESDRKKWNTALWGIAVTALVGIITKFIAG